MAKSKRIEFDLPDGFTLPDSISSSDEFEALATVKLKDDGSACLVALVKGCRDTDMPSWMPESDVILPTDSEMRAAAKWCSLLIISNGNKASKFPEGCIPLPGDDLDRLLIKIDVLTNT
jgi:hypothetical protein